MAHFTGARASHLSSPGSFNLIQLAMAMILLTASMFHYPYIHITPEISCSNSSSSSSSRRSSSTSSSSSSGSSCSPSVHILYFCQLIFPFKYSLKVPT